MTVSPSFAREASRHLHDGDIQSAVQLCLEGTKVFPLYATGHLVLGKCHEALGRTVEALIEYRKALNILPDNPAVQLLVANAEKREQGEFHRFAEEQEKKLPGKKETIPATQVLTPEAPREESAIEYLAKRLQDVKRIQPTGPPVPEIGNSVRSVKFVTTTMAEIYAGQGEYEEAIKAYKEVVKEHPEEEEKIKKRIAEIEQLLAIQQGEKKLEGPANKKAS